ncbi:MAG: hypothetical protein QM778_32330 [Myxococcales bacterium]
MRRLTGEEQAFLVRYFGGALDLEPIRLSTSIGARSWSPYGARISLVKGLYRERTLEAGVALDDPRAASVFAHEAIHVWQRQRGRAVTRPGAWLQTLYFLGIRDPYAYVPRLDARCLLSEFVLGNVEQQGKIFQDYVFAERTGQASERFSRIAAWVRLSASK